MAKTPDLFIVPAKAVIYQIGFLDPGIRRDDDNLINRSIPNLFLFSDVKFGLREPLESGYWFRLQAKSRDVKQSA